MDKRIYPNKTEMDEIKAKILEVAKSYRTSFEEILAPGRGPAYVARARQLCIAHVRHKYPHLSTVVIGALFNRDHSTVIHAIACVDGNKNGF